MTDISDLGVDPREREAISEVLMDAASDGDLLYLPPGEYSIDENIELTGLDRFGIMGDDAKLFPEDGLSGPLIFIRGEGPIQLTNLHFDFNEGSQGARALDVRAPDGLVIRDVKVTGEKEDGRGPIRVDLTDPNGSGLVERLQLADGSVNGERITGCYVGDENRGDITFKDCTVVGFGDNGLYADPEVGRMIVDGGYYANNGIANVRVRAGCIVRNVHVRCDDGSKGFDNMRGIRLTNHDADPEAEPPLVENCLVEMIEVSASDGGITLSSELPSMTVRNTDVKIDADNVNGIWAKTPADKLFDAGVDLSVALEGVTVTGAADNEFGIKIDGRSNCTLSRIDVTHAATNRNGIGFQRSQNNVLRDANVDVGGIPILLQNATVETINTNLRPNGIQSATEDGS